jgi:hypothetical protein
MVRLLAFLYYFTFFFTSSTASFAISLRSSLIFFAFAGATSFKDSISSFFSSYKSSSFSDASVKKTFHFTFNSSVSSSHCFL